jgi:hypothetical protein
MAVRNNDTKVCVMRGFYNESDEYIEQYREDVALYELPQMAQNRVNFDYDVTLLYSKNEVLVIAKKSQDIEEYKKLKGTPRFFHSLLHMAEYRHGGYNGYMCILINLKALKKRHK